MLLRLGLIGCFGLFSAFAQSTCEGTAAFSPCEFTFELSASEAAAHLNLYQEIELHIEFRSPRFHTYMMPAFWAGGRKLIVRFTPTEPGAWIYKITSNLPSLEGKAGNFNAAESDLP